MFSRTAPYQGWTENLSFCFKEGLDLEGSCKSPCSSPFSDLCGKANQNLCY